jgi:Mg2+ and Co2+ transporter CorA
VATIILVNPKFDVSFWGMEYAMPLLGKRSVMPVAALPLLAALAPERHQFTIIDENV